MISWPSRGPFGNKFRGRMGRSNLVTSRPYKPRWGECLFSPRSLSSENERILNTTGRPSEYTQKQGMYYDINLGSKLAWVSRLLLHGATGAGNPFNNNSAHYSFPPYLWAHSWREHNGTVQRQPSDNQVPEPRIRSLQSARSSGRFVNMPSFRDYEYLYRKMPNIKTLTV